MIENKPDQYQPTEKVVKSQTSKKWYFIRYSDSKFFITHGMQITTLYPVYQFIESFWLTKYNKYNEQQTIEAKCEIEKLVHQLLNYVFYGKAKENSRKGENWIL